MPPELLYSTNNILTVIELVFAHDCLIAGKCSEPTHLDRIALAASGAAEQNVVRTTATAIHVLFIDPPEGFNGKPR
jgi:hypothetical protein